MWFKSFKIKNFKGIEKVTLKLDKIPIGKVYTLVGLNESGKTTILEAISYLTTSGEHTFKDLCDPSSYSFLDDPHSLIPINSLSNFNDEISVKATISFENNDIEEIKEYVKSKYDLLLELGENFTINKISKFKDSIHQDTTTYWNIEILTKKNSRIKKYTSLDSKREEWKDIIKYIKEKIPFILYYPTFLFEIPEKIYIDINYKSSDDKSFKINTYYKDIIQDLLSSVDNNTTIEQHIVERFRTGDGNQKKAAEQLLHKMSLRLSNDIFSLWNEIFDIKIDKKQIEIKCDSEKGKDNQDHYFVELRIKEGANIFNITQRSLGFRWFFCFILFTQLKTSDKKSKGLFLLDEPASNLHSTAQAQLLKSFNKITKNDSVIIYSTHSQYLINTEWLENTYVIENVGLHYNDNDFDNYSSKNTNIKAVLYREFVNQNPSQTTYFQPILDVLNYIPCSLENIPRVVMMEGKTDFYILKYFNDIIFKGKYDINILPGMGSNNLDPIISLYLGWGRQFIVLLDSDKAGKNAKERYVEKYYLGEEVIFTLSDINLSWNNHKIESIINKDDITAVKKKNIDRFFQEKLINNEVIKISVETKDNFDSILSFINNSLN